MSWLTELMKMHEEVESPREFWRWAGLAALSAVAKDSVWIDRAGLYNLYPNIYVMLHAHSGLKKGPPVNLAKRLVKKVNNTRIISGRSSIQGIMKKLGTAQTAPGGKVVAKSVGFICASEFSSSLVNDPAAMTLLTDLYDRNYNEGDWEHLLKMEEFKLVDPTITLLVATNEAHFEDFVASKDKKGGFMGRMFVIAETEVNRLNALVDDLAIRPDEDKLVPHLKEVAKLTGPFAPLKGTKAGERYKAWYHDFYTQVKDQHIKDDTGTINRLGDSVVKVALLLSLADSTSKEISEDNMEDAIFLCERLIGNIRKTTAGKNGSEATNANRKWILIQELMQRENHMVTRALINKKYWMHGNLNEWDEAAQSLEAGGVIRIESPGSVITFVMPENIYEEYQRYFQGKHK